MVAGRSAAHGPCREPHPSPVSGGRRADPLSHRQMRILSVGIVGWPGTSDHVGPVRLEFPILSLNPGLRQRCVGLASGLGDRRSRAVCAFRLNGLRGRRPAAAVARGGLRPMGGRSQAARAPAPRTPTATIGEPDERFASGSGVPAPRTRGRVGPVEQIHWESTQESLQVPDSLSARLR